MSDKILGQMLGELQKAGDLQEELYKIKRMFDWPVGKEGFVEHMQKWKNAQPITNMSIIEKLDSLHSEADSLYCDAQNLDDDVGSALNKLEECCDIQYEVNDLSTLISQLIGEIKNPKEQAEADMEDAE